MIIGPVCRCGKGAVVMASYGDELAQWRCCDCDDNRATASEQGLLFGGERSGADDNG